MALRSGYDVETMNSQLITPLRLGPDPVEYPPPLLGVETLALRMKRDDHDLIEGATRGSVGEIDGHFHGTQDYAVSVYGRGYKFNGTSDRYIHVHYDTFLSTPTFSLSLWVRVRGEDGGVGAHVVGRGPEATAPWFLRVDDPAVGRKLTFGFRTSAGLFTVSIPAVDFKLGRWQHVIVTAGGGSIKIYKDLVLKGTTAYTGTPSSTTDDMFIATSDGTAKRFQGMVKDLRFMPVIATSTQRQALYGAFHPKAIHTYLQAWHDGVWGQLATDLEFARQQFYVPTARGIFLDKHGKPTETIRRPGEENESYRIRIIADRRRLFGGVTIDAALEIVETVVGATDTGAVRLVENEQVGGQHEPAYFRIEFNTDLLLDQGFTVAEIPGVRAEVEKQLNKVCAAGVRVDVILRSGASWDNGDSWNDPGTLWGS